jgi:general stress protein CsbA
MKDKDIYSELSSIRNLMERSTKFISLSGLSGILAGIYALIGAFVGYKLVYTENSGLLFRDFYVNDPMVWWPLFAVALVVLILSLVTGIWLTIRQAQKKNENYWNPVSKRLLTSMAIPLITGGLFILILIFRRDYGIICSTCLLFYGLALVSGSQFTFTDVKWLGFCEIALGLFAALLPGYGIVFWIIGFGILHIVYGSIMHFKYKQ